ncbi:MAG: hypothetical protein PF448_01185 [Bacteroidales bacterium]|jgi:hypothetical protein|nr:hypothetical protein [Bacteroidales bacterium]
MKSLLPLLIIGLLFGLISSCQNNQSNKTEISENTEQNTSDTQNKTVETDTQEGPVSETSIAPVKINPAKIELGDIILGHEVKSVDYQEKFVFGFMLKGDFCFDGKLSLGMADGIDFTPNEVTRDKAQIVIDEMQKPLYMWTTFTNTDAFHNALGEENVKKLEGGEMMDVSICFKNYQVIAMETEIKAEAEFVSVDF